jgi:serine/threonine-protein kinase RsbW
MHVNGAGSAEEWSAASPVGTMRYAFTGKLEQLREARQVVEKLFAGTGHEDDAGLIVGELATNAVLYTRSGREGGWFGVEISFEFFARIAVVDLGAAGWLIGNPRKDAVDARDPLLEEELSGFQDEELSLGGRGLAIVAELSVVTGACGSDALGHRVWAELDLAGGALTRVARNRSDEAALMAF